MRTKIITLSLAFLLALSLSAFAAALPIAERRTQDPGSWIPAARVPTS